MKNTEVLVIIPTHDHPTTLPWSLKSAQEQTVSDIRIVIIGDGVSNDTRTVLKPFLENDDRVTFLDKPKGKRNGEQYRHELIRSSTAKYICYLGDDDLFFPNHVEHMINMIQDNDFINPLPVLINPNGTLHFVPTDLANDASLQWHCDENEYKNSVSLTGVLHTKKCYDRLPYGWRPAPKNRWSDHYMWEQFFTLQDFKAITTRQSTTAKFASNVRQEDSPQDREKEIRTFWENLQKPGFEESWNIQVRDAIWKSSVHLFLSLEKVSSENQYIEEAMRSTSCALILSNHLLQQEKMMHSMTIASYKESLSLVTNQLDLKKNESQELKKEIVSLQEKEIMRTIELQLLNNVRNTNKKLILLKKVKKYFLHKTTFGQRKRRASSRSIK